mgnify:CR=1 FL=1
MPNPSGRTLNVLVIGAHPDDPDFSAGGVAALYARQGHRVKFVSLTNGCSGHHEIGGVELARRRYGETRGVLRALGLADYEVLDIPDGALEPTLANRWKVIEVIRKFKPDLILGPRPNDYHPDHRYTSQLIQDAAYMVVVPNVLPLTEQVRTNPVIAYVADNFQKPYPFTPDVAVAIDDVIDHKIEALHSHTSQMYEWLPWVDGLDYHAGDVPEGEAERKAWLAKRYLPRFEEIANRYRNLLIKLYGPEKGGKVRYAEAFEGCEYGSRLTAERIPELFPFFG